MNSFHSSGCLFARHRHRLEAAGVSALNTMKSRTEHLTFNVPEKMASINITPRGEEIVRQSGVQDGLVLANAMHFTAKSKNANPTQAVQFRCEVPIRVSAGFGVKKVLEERGPRFPRTIAV